MEAEDEKAMSEAEKVKQWHERITKAEKEYEPFHDLIKETREYYKNESKKNKHSIFWASVETMKPFLYFKQPRPYVDRKEKTSDPAEMVACKIIEKALAWDLAQFDFDSVIKYVRNDFLISGMGLAEEKYEAEFEDIVENGDLLPLKKSEKVVTSYIDPVDFIPKRLIESGARKENTKTLIVGFVGALVVSALLVLIPLVQVVALNAEIGSLNKSIKKLSIINDVVNEYYSAKDKYNDIAAFAALTSDSDDALQDFVDYLEKSMPSDITIQSFNVASGAITVNGTAGSKSSVAKFIQELQKNSSVLNVDAPTITETKDNAGTIEVTFSLSCTFVGGTSNTTDMKSSNTSNSTKNSSTKSSTTK